MRKRDILLGIGASVATGYPVLPTSAQEINFSPRNGKWRIPFDLADCAALERQVSEFEAMLSALRANPDAMASDLMSRAISRRTELKATIAELKKDEIQADKDLFFAKVNLALGIVFLAFALVFTSPIAVGVILGVQVVAAVGILGWQLLDSVNEKSAPILIGYSRDRTLFFGDAMGEAVKSTPGRIVNSTIKAAALLFSAWDLNEASGDARSIKDKLKMATAQLEFIEGRYAVLGTNKAAWANFIENSLQASIARLKDYINATRRAGCQLRGAIIINP